MRRSTLRTVIPVRAAFRLAAGGTVAIACALLSLAVPAEAARPSPKKGMWGETTHDFRIYKQLGVRLVAYRLPWDTIATKRPAHPRDPADPAYAWLAGTDRAIRKAARRGMKIAVEVQGAPSWANGGGERYWVPWDPRDYGRFMAAAARRYPQVDYWVIWAEPSRVGNFLPLVDEISPSTPLDRERQGAPRFYARMLDSAYGQIKRVRPRAKVVGGNTFSGGDISALNWIRSMRLPDGRRPRMDLYGHHPFTTRYPDLRRTMITRGRADMSDLDDLMRWLDRYQRPGLKLFLGEFTLPTARNPTFGYHLTLEAQASWIRSTLRIVRRTRRIAALVWLPLRDTPELPGGLIDSGGRRKPAFSAFANG
jgi:hypothetical protein